tara:strand:+ start:231 stop:431 length:201 start_codon:yes stop_codon:yes gene_type:complete
MIPRDPDHHIPTVEAALFLGVTPKTLRNWRARKIGPAWARPGLRTVVYRVGDLIAFMEARRQTAEA